MRKKEILAVYGVSAVITAVYLLINMNNIGLMNALINGLSITGILNLLLALSCHVRNGGQFRVFGYRAYNKHKKQLASEIESGALPADTVIPTFMEYSDEKYKKKWDPLPFYAGSVPILILAVLLLPQWTA